MVTRGLAESRNLAQRLVMAGQVRVNGQLELKPSTLTPLDAQIELERAASFVSRGGDKLAAGLSAFALPVRGLVCADIGASTGGFTDCLLQNGATRVYAIDVGKGILHWKLRNDPRVVVMEGTNARFLELMPEAVDLVTIDASFISLKLLLPVVSRWFQQDPSRQGQVVALIKPQFEAGKTEAARGEGVIRDSSLRQKIVEDILEFARQLGFQVEGTLPSPLLGPKGNVEYLVWLSWSETSHLQP